MNETVVKKIFVPKIYPSDMDMSKRWFVRYYEPVPYSDVLKRKKTYGNFSKLFTVKERLEHGEALIQEILKRQKQGVEVDIFPKNTSEREKEVTLFLAVVEDKKLLITKKSLQSFISIVNLFLDWLGKSKSPFKINNEDARAFLHNQLEIGKNANTVNGYKVRLKSFYNTAIERKHLKENPFNGIKKLKYSATSKKHFNLRQQSEIKAEAIQKDPQLWLACKIRPLQNYFEKNVIII